MKKEEWILGSEAAAIMTRNSGHRVTPNYIRLLASPTHGKIRSRMRDGRTREYHRRDVEEYRVARKSKESGEDEHQPFAMAV